MLRRAIPRPAPRQVRVRRDWGRALAKLFCLMFAVIGAIPLTGGVLLRSTPVQNWAASETSRLLLQELGVEATFTVELSLVPLRLAVTNLEVPATDGGSPAVVSNLIAVSPRFFSLLAGRIDVGDIEVENTTVRLVMKEGEVNNVAYHFPETDSDAPALDSAPFRSLAITNATLDLDIDGQRVTTGAIDVDAIVEEKLSFDVALHLDGAQVDTKRLLSEEQREERQNKAWFDEDRICELDLRVFLSQEEIIIRRLSLRAALDTEEAPNTPAECSAEDPDRLALRLSQLRITPEQTGLPRLRGHVMARAPLALVNRLGAGVDGSGWIGFSGDLALDGSTRLPELSGRLRGADMRFVGKSVGEKLNAQVLITGDVVQVPHLQANWGNGEATLEGIRIEPFAEKIPVSIEKVISHEIDLPGVLRDIDVTKHAWVDWNFGDTDVTKIRGTLDPFYLDGGVSGQTHDFMVWDRGFDDAGRQPMVGLKKASVSGRFRANPQALEFYNCDVKFGSSHLPVDLVSVGLFDNPLIVRLKEGGGNIDLADISPIAAIDLAGRSQLYVNLEGPTEHPTLKGTLSVEDFVIEGFEAGHIVESNVHFEPLFVEFSALKGEKGALKYTLPTARLDFDGPAGVEFSAGFDSQSFDVEEFLNIFHFDEDPRFSELAGAGTVKAQVRYLLGGPEDTCGDGRLTVEGAATLNAAELLGESFSGGETRFSLEWFDVEAGVRGMRLDVPHVVLRKGSGSVFGSLQVDAGGVLSGDLLATRIPISRIDALGNVLKQTDGFISGAGNLAGSIENLGFTADLRMTSLKAGDAELPASNLHVKQLPLPYKENLTEALSGCGRRIPQAPTASAAPSEADYQLSGQLFGQQISIEQLTVQQGKGTRLRGHATLNKLDLATLAAFTPAALLGRDFGNSRVSGQLSINELVVEDLFSGNARLDLSDALVEVDDLSLALEGKQTALLLKDGVVKSEHLSIVARSEDGQEGILDGEITIDRNQEINASLDLRPSNLSVLAAALPGVTRANGNLSASFGLQGKLSDPRVSGFVEVEQGELTLSQISTPLTNLELTVALDQGGLRVMKGTANWGGGKVQLTGDAPLSQGRLGRTDLNLVAREISLPLDEDFQVKFDADLKLNIPPPSDTSKTLPRLSGKVNILTASYEKPMNITADISDFTSRGTKTEVADYDASKDSVKLDILLTSTQPLRVKNALVQATLSIDRAGLRISGTDQQYGAVGTVEIQSGGQVFLRRNEFDVQGGLVRFNDPTRLRPEVDVTALTEYRRYEDRGATSGATTVATDSSGSTAGAGNWRIMMRAYGPPENLKVDLTSDPPLAPDDIFLLLTVGLTRTELDQTSNSNVGSAVALEALGSLSGAESAVTETVPVDEFRFGSTYSSHSGRTEPTVTIGKRLGDRIRASVTTSLSDSSEVRSNVEYRATDNLSVEGSYDNAGNAASAAAGNLGGDVRWRIEFK